MPRTAFSTLTLALLQCSSPNCAACLAAGTCAACENGYGLKGGRCHRCKEANCAGCNGGPNTCQLCDFGFGLATRGGRPKCVKVN